MEEAMQKHEPPVQPASAVLGRSARMRDARRLIFLIVALWVAATGRAADSYAVLLDKHFEAEPEASSNAVPAPDSGAVDTNVLALERALKAQGQKMAERRRVVVPPPPTSHNSLVLAVVWPLAALLALGIIGYYLIKRRSDSLNTASAQREDRSEAVLLEDPSLAAFFIALRHSLNAPPPEVEVPGPVNGVQPQTGENKPDPIQEFFASAPSRLARVQQLFSDISRAANEAVRQNILLEFLRQVSGLKDIARAPELRPVWLMAYALEGLFKQLSSNASEVTPSVLRTGAGAVDLLQTLCVRGLNPNLATKPPIKLLAVDDDPISLHAISFALKKAFNPPDLAPDGETALGMAAGQTYDVIFLDVNMPGMDGYELCTKIHQPDRHRTTPVVFVTGLNDFNSRAKSMLSGGESHIAKPFLASEITVKALTLALRGRLQSRTAPVESLSASKAAADRTAPAIPAIAAEASAAIASPSEHTALNRKDSPAKGAIR
jgi:CheY-like chemotaxis protein